MVAIANSAAWQGRVQLTVFHLDQDPAPGRKYLPITGATLVVDEVTKITRINAASVTGALERAIAARVGQWKT